MTLSQLVKSHGYKSLSQFVKLTGKGVNTIRRWHTENPALLNAVLIGFKDEAANNE